MFQRIFILVFIVLTCTFVSCEHLKGSKKEIKTSLGDYTRYYDEDYRFSIEFPTNWHITHRSRDSRLKEHFSLIFNAISPDEEGKDPFKERIGVVVIDLAEMRKRRIGEGEKKKPQHSGDTSKISEAGFSRIEGVVVNWQISKSYKPEKQNVKLRQMSFDIKKDGVIYKIGWVGEAKQLKKYQPIVWRVAHSLKIEGVI